MRIAICADLHLNNNSYGKIMDDGLPLKVHDNFAALKFFVDQCIEQKINRVVVVGDVYDNPGPTSKIRALFNDHVQKLLNAGIEVRILVGNHDTCMEHHALSPIKGWNNKLMVIENKNIEADGTNVFAYIPHSKDIESKKETFKEVIDKLKETSKKLKGKRLVIFGHFSVSGSMNNDVCTHYNAKDPSTSDLEDIGCEAFFLGHFHKHQKLSEKQSIYYVGSLERQTFSERDQPKGYCIYDTETKEVEYIQTPARKMVEIVTYNYEELMGQIESLDLKDTIVKIKVAGKESDYAHIQQRFGEVSTAVTKNATFFCGLEKPKAEEKKDTYQVETDQNGDLDIFKILEEEIKVQSKDEDEKEISARVSLLEQVKKEIDSDLKMSSKSTLSGKRTVRFKSVEYHNFCRFGETSNVVDFEKLFGDSDGIASVAGMVDMDEEEANGAGKSALLEGIAYALYERMPRLCSVDEKKKATTTEIIRTNDAGEYACDETFVKLTMDIEGDK